MKVCGVISSLFFFLLVLSFSQAHDVQVTLELESLQLNQQEQSNFQVRINIENKGEHISFPEMALPTDENIQSKVFQVISTSTGRRAIYTGISALHDPSKLPLLYLPSLQSRSSSINLLNFYHFEEDGEYEVKLNSVMPSLEGSSLHFTSNSVFLQVTGSSPFVHQSKERALYFASCSGAETSALDNIVSEQANVIDFLISNYLIYTCTNNGYEEFFYDSNYYNDVSTTFDNVFSLITDTTGVENINFDCAPSSCGPSTIAYVVPTDTTLHTINICSNFWTLSSNPNTYNSQQGALTNQMVRFDDIAYAPSVMTDVAFTVDACLALVPANPQLAVNNPSSYQYFQEVTPFCGELNLIDCYSPSAGLGSYYVDDCVNVCNNLGSSYPVPFFCSPAPRKGANDVVAVTTIGTTDSTYWTLAARVKANTFVNVTQLQPGTTYYFSTCRLSDDGEYFNADPKLPFPTSLVIRDPNQSILEFNFGCYSCDNDNNGALLEYIHPSSATYSFIYIDVYFNPYPQSSTTPTSCNRESSTAVPLYQRAFAVTAPSPSGPPTVCNQYLQPSPSTYTASLDSTGNTATVLPQQVSNSRDSSFCYNTQSFSITPSSFDCSDIGSVDVTVTQTSGAATGQSIQTSINVVDSILPTITCTRSTLWLDGRNFTAGEFCAQVSFPINDDFSCFISVSQVDFLAFPVDFDDNCAVTSREVTSVSAPSAISIVSGYNNVVVGYTATDRSANSFSRSCSTQFYGLFIIDVPTETTFRGENFLYDITFRVAAAAGDSGANAYLYLSSVGNSGLPYDFDDEQFRPLTSSNIIANSLDSRTITTSGLYTFSDVEFPYTFPSSPNAFKLTVALVGVNSNPSSSLVLSYGDPVVYLIS